MPPRDRRYRTPLALAARAHLFTVALCLSLALGADPATWARIVIVAILLADVVVLVAVIVREDRRTDVR